MDGDATMTTDTTTRLFADIARLEQQLKRLQRRREVDEQTAQIQQALCACWRRLREASNATKRTE
jgi:hypothetical protein